MRDQKGGTNDKSGNANRTSIRRWRTHPGIGFHPLEVIHAAGLIDFDFGEGLVTPHLHEELSISTFGM